MIIDEIKKQNIVAMKEKNTNARNIYSIIMNKYLLASIELRSKGTEISDVDMIHIIQKTIKELDEEYENYSKVNNTTEMSNITAQKEILSQYLPKMLSIDEIKQIIDTLEDKSVPAVMKYFKLNYAGKVNMADVSKAMK